MSFTIKNHVSKRAKRVAGTLQGKYGLSLNLLDQALKGDKQALQVIGEAGKQGALIQELMPLLTEAYLSTIKGTEEYNKGLTTIVKQGASSNIAIDKASSQAMLANKKYINQREEVALDFSNARATEITRHQYAINYAHLKAYIERYLTQVDNEAKAQEQANRPELKQIDEDAKYFVASAKHLLQNGDASKLELVPRREYAVITEGGESFSFKKKLSQFASALGF
jgi:negative regulator of replication initiation